MSKGLEAKEFILSRPEFNVAALAKSIGWLPTAMHEWLKGNRGIPETHLHKLEELLQLYGFGRG
jgi:hypothetical protein